MIITFKTPGVKSYGVVQTGEKDSNQKSEKNQRGFVDTHQQKYSAPAFIRQ